MGNPSRKGDAILAIPAWQSLHEAVLAADCLDLGTRLRPAWRTDERAHYELPAGAVVAVATGGGLLVHRAYVAREDGVAETSTIAAEDLLDPPGAARRAWGRRVRAAGLSSTPTQFRFRPGHGYEAETIYDWHGQEYVAACVRACASHVWVRAVTYAEAVELGVA